MDDFYTTPEVMHVESATVHFPETLHTFLNPLFVGDSVHQNIASIGHAIILAVRLRVVLASTGASEPTSTMHLIDSIYKGNSRKTCIVFKALANPIKIDFGSSDNSNTKLIFCCTNLASFMTIIQVVVFTQPV